MNTEETADTKPKPAEESAGGHAEQRFEMPACCRHMMAQMMGTSCCGSENDREGASQEDASEGPGILGRLMRRMMEACCGKPPEEKAGKPNTAI